MVETENFGSSTFAGGFLGLGLGARDPRNAHFEFLTYEEDVFK